ncbi:MAG: hypothetical protein V7643_401, partial [Mycobacterium sp.]
MFLMTTFCEDTTRLRPGPIEETVPAGAMPLAEMLPTFRSRVPGRDDPHRSDPRRHMARPDAHHDSHGPSTSQERHRYDLRRLHQRADVPHTGGTQVLHEPLTERLALHEPATERIVRKDLAPLDTYQLTEQAVEAKAEGLVAPPGDNEVYSYFGAQMRWVQILLLAASVLAGWSLLHFAIASIAVLWPMLIVL